VDRGNDGEKEKGEGKNGKGEGKGNTRGKGKGKAKGKGKGKARGKGKRKLDESEEEVEDEEETEEEELWVPADSDDELDQLEGPGGDEQWDPTPPSTPKMRPGFEINPALQEELDSMSLRDRRFRLRYLRSLGRFFFDKINDDATKSQLLKKQSAGSPSRPRPRKRVEVEVVIPVKKRVAPAPVESPDVDMQDSSITGPAPAAVTANSLPNPQKDTDAFKVLRLLIGQFPDTLDEGTKDDDLARQCYSSIPWSADMSGPESWEYWNGNLDTLLQKRTDESQEDFEKKLVKKGEFGTVALYKALVHVGDNVVMDPEMLDGKIGRVINAIKNR
jgi:hypothetical protein